MTSPPLDRLPSALSEHTGYLLVRLGKHAQRLFSAAVAPLELRPAHCDVLLTLRERGPQSQVTIADTLAIERAHLVQLLDQLGALGHTRRDPDPQDRRRHQVVLTAEGERIAGEVSRIAGEVEATLLSELPLSEQRSLRATLRALAAGADEGD